MKFFSLRDCEGRSPQGPSPPFFPRAPPVPNLSFPERCLPFIAAAPLLAPFLSLLTMPLALPFLRRRRSGNLFVVQRPFIALPPPHLVLALQRKNLRADQDFS